jgi:hypothetical protein
MSIDGVTMSKKYDYTTIQITKEINKHIREFCKLNGFVASTITEKLWANHISSSMSGSISFTGI